MTTDDLWFSLPVCVALNIGVVLGGRSALGQAEVTDFDSVRLPLVVDQHDIVQPDVRMNHMSTLQVVQSASQLQGHKKHSLSVVFILGVRTLNVPDGPWVESLSLEDV